MAELGLRGSVAVVVAAVLGLVLLVAEICLFGVTRDELVLLSAVAEFIRALDFAALHQPEVATVGWRTEAFLSDRVAPRVVPPGVVAEGVAGKHRDLGIASDWLLVI